MLGTCWDSYSSTMLRIWIIVYFLNINHVECHRDISQHHHLVDSLILLLKNKVSSIQCSKPIANLTNTLQKNGANSLLVNVDIPI